MAYLVVKCGGSVLEQLPKAFYENIVTLAKDYHVDPVIVHGGGPMVSSLLADLDITTSFVDGMRVTTEPVLDVVEMVLSGSTNKHIVRNIQVSEGNAIGLSGVDGGLLEARRLSGTQHLGFVGEVTSVNTKLLKGMLAQGQIPVISPIAADRNGQRWNINADLAAAAIAKALNAPLYLITNVSGVLHNGDVIHQLNAEDVQSMIESGDIYGGMIPKVQAAMQCLQQGIERVVILNGLTKDSLLYLADGKKIGTSITLHDKQAMANEQKGGIL
ncbi:acetylglutamate kinase [Lentibacillus sp. N15]|uniref:acetylglutamate kinase n=1 Tax=Lentibacillus songyuanensis TaxID=3136161 RepID=UPI0031BA363B